VPIHLPPLSRRTFLKSTLAAGALAAVPGRADAKPTVDPNRLALLADTHVWANTEDPCKGVKPAETCRAALDQVLACSPRPANLVIVGDLAHLHGRPGDYAVLKDLLDPVRRGGVAVHLVLGNHDHRANVYAAFPQAKPPGAPAVAGKHVAVVHTPLADLVLLDSLNETNATPGLLGDAQRAWLGRTLDAPGKPAFVMAHHNPDTREKPSGLVDTPALFKALALRTRAKVYAFGHTHRWSYRQHGDVHLVNVPATAHLFDKKQPRGWLDARIETGGARVTLNVLKTSDPRHGKTERLAWRA